MKNKYKNANEADNDEANSRLLLISNAVKKWEIFSRR
jgi:hypothetical protein